MDRRKEHEKRTPWEEGEEGGGRRWMVCERLRCGGKWGKRKRGRCEGKEE